MGTRLEGVIDGRFAELRSSINDLRNDMHAGFQRVDGEITALRGDLSGKIDNLQREMDNHYDRTVEAHQKLAARVSALEKAS